MPDSTLPRDAAVTVLFDVDDTLLDNDRFSADLDARLRQEAGPARAQRYWAILEELRAERGYVDYLDALQRFRLESPADPIMPALSEYLLEYPFEQRLYPKALEVLARARSWGTAAILSDGDIVFQPLKTSPLR
jgi:FMN phosphatase YigB (HAD superfamily)